MTNKDRQKSLDKKKWLLSEKVGTDQSGKMLWCESCKYCNLGKCGISHEQRNNENSCARAYNAMARK